LKTYVLLDRYKLFYYWTTN